MRIVIQCAGRKHCHAGKLRVSSGEDVVFVAHPELCDSVSSPIRYCKPDDGIGQGIGTWRDELVAYNQRGQNPDRLLRAAELYKPSEYRLLVDSFGWRNVFILSAGWGLIRADFLTPYYDITFSVQGKPWSRRSNHLPKVWKDFNQLRDAHISPDEPIHFFGGQDYLPLFYELTRNLPGRKIIHHKTNRLLRLAGFEYELYCSRRNTNWHYQAALAFINAHANQTRSD